jgi:hypothetical protein
MCPVRLERTYPISMVKTLIQLGGNVISLIGVVLVTTAGVLWLFLLPSYWNPHFGSPYMGILQYLALPGVFFSGLVLMPAGVWIHNYRRRQAGQKGPELPQGNELRRLATFFLVTSVLNVIIGSHVLYGAVTYMDSVQFCGETCHTVMEPEYTSYQYSPHARVACVECHIGPGASWFVKSKISGTGQVLAVVLHTYPTPIPTPVTSLRPARETCEQCHWPARFSGDLLFVRTHYGDDEKNTATYTVGLMKVGGLARGGAMGIHGIHAASKGHIEYISTDDKRQVIPRVVYTDASGKVTIFNSTDAPPTEAALQKGEHRTMDCIDCHNRPTHVFQLPEQGVDQAMSDGQISTQLPFIKRQAVEVLKGAQGDRDAAVTGIATKLENYYHSNYPEVEHSQTAALKFAIKAVQVIYLRNVFPAMKVTWGTYPNNIGHMDFPGCFRCHDGNHTSASGTIIPNDCSTCHDMLAVDETNPKILSALGVTQPPPNATGGLAN